MQFDRQRLHGIERLARELIELVGFDKADVDHPLTQPISCLHWFKRREKTQWEAADDAPS